jgi:hypothetical protein
MYLEKVFLHILYIIIIVIITTSIMSFIKLPSYVYTPYMYFYIMLIIVDLFLVEQSNL